MTLLVIMNYFILSRTFDSGGVGMTDKEGKGAVYQFLDWRKMLHLTIWTVTSWNVTARDFNYLES